MGDLRRSYGPCALLAATLFFSGSARGAAGDALDQARTLFGQGEADEDAQRWADALAKFHAVSEIKLTAGIRYHMAFCEEHLGHLSAALAGYQEAEDQARLDDAKDVLQAVSKQLAALEPRLPRLTIRLVGAQDASVTIDGQVVTRPLLGEAIPADPGAHRIEAMTTDGRISAAVVSLKESESREVDVDLEPPSPAQSAPPAPKPEPPPAPVPRPTPPAPTRSVRHHAAAATATAVAIALAGGGTAAYLMGGIEHDHDMATCAAIHSPSLDACDWLKDRVRAWDFGAAGAWTGALLAASVATVLWTRPGEGTTGVGTHVFVGLGSVGLGGRF